MINELVMIDDEKSLAVILSRFLESTNWKFTYYYDGYEAIEYLKTHIPSVLIVDVRMPLINGDEIIKELRKHNYLYNVEVFIASNAKPPPYMLKEFKALNATFLKKDSLYDKEKLLQLLKTYH
jgi:CheY-like chemotaxis protein